MSQLRRIQADLAGLGVDVAHERDVEGGQHVAAADQEGGAASACRGVVEHAHRAVGRQRAVTLLAPVEDEDVGLYGRHGEPQCGACGSESDRGCLHPYKDTCLAARTGYGPISAGL